MPAVVMFTYQKCLDKSDLAAQIYTLSALFCHVAPEFLNQQEESSYNQKS